LRRRRLSVRELTNGVLRNGAGGTTGRPRGARIREAIERILREEGENACIVLNFSGVGSIDFSWADEVVAKIISRLWGGEYGEKYLVLRGLNASQMENIGVALERKRLAALLWSAEGWKVVGVLNNYLSRTLNRVMERSHLTLRELSEEEGIGMNTSGTRLLNLYKKRLVMRLESPGQSKEESHRGRPFVYRSLLG